jgi:hypothetical protein
MMACDLKSIESPANPLSRGSYKPGLRSMRKKIVIVLVGFIFIVQGGYACTVISAALKGEVFAASNEDDYVPFARIWFNPATKDRYGSVCLGLNDLSVQTAVNEFGLFMDFTAQNIDPAQYHIKNPYQGDWAMDILGKCKTVNEALEFVKAHPYAHSAQALIADALGNSVIINAGAQVEKNGPFQINTNFNISDLKTGKYSCQRYDISQQMLSQTTELSVPFFKNLLSRVRQEGNLSTQYSIICDLKKGLIYLYHFHDFDNVYVIDLKKELKKGYKLGKVSDLFPISFAYETYARQSPLFQKEQILDQIEKANFHQALEPYLSASNDQKAKKDSALSMSVLEVALQLVKNSWNQHEGGQMWGYWFNLPSAYEVPRWQDQRLLNAGILFKTLMKDPALGIKEQNFVAEIYAYTQLVLGNPEEARRFYQQVVVKPDESFPVSYQRSKAMLAKI